MIVSKPSWQLQRHVIAIKWWLQIPIQRDRFKEKPAAVKRQ
jgi:hypothetical protein